MSRVTCTPYNFNQGASGATFPVSPSAGVDAAGAGGSTFATAWSGNSGVQFINNGYMLVYYVCGATPTTAYVLIGEPVGGQVPLYSTISYSITANTSGWLGPWSPQAYNQQSATNYQASFPGGASIGGVIGTAAVGMTCIDFTATTTLSARVMQLVPVLP